MFWPIGRKVWPGDGRAEHSHGKRSCHRLFQSDMRLAVQLNNIPQMPIWIRYLPSDLTAAAIQFISFTSDLVSKYSKIRKAVNGAPDEVLDVEFVYAPAEEDRR